MTNSMVSMGSGSMSKGSVLKGMSSDHHMMPMHHIAKSKMSMGMCHKMSHSRMMHNSQCHGMMMHHGKMMKRGM